MEQRTLHNKVDVSRVCLGTMTFGGQADRGSADRMLGVAFDRGVNFVDTANVYTAGESERMLGALLGPRRARTILASKIGMKTLDEQPGLSRRAIFAAVENSLSRLATDHLDICYLHLPDWSVALDESLDAMDALVRQGKVRYVGSSNFASWQVCKMHWIAAQCGYAPTRVSQPMYNLLARRIEDEFLPACRDLGVSNIVYNPLAGGLLTGKQSASKPLPGTRFDGNRGYLDRYWHDLNFEAVEKLGKAASAEGRSLVSLALNWLLHHTATDCVILGASRVEQLEENLDSLEQGPLSDASLTACDAVWQGLKGSGPKYNR